MSKYVTALEVRPLDGFRLWLRFSDGATGVRDFADILAEGGEVIEPIRDEAIFKRVFLSVGVPTWPSGLQLDASTLHMELAARDALQFRTAAEWRGASHTQQSNLMLTRVIALEVVHPYKLRVRFDDGSYGVHDCAHLIDKAQGVTAELRDTALFERAFLDEGAPTWPNLVDMDPEWLRREMLDAGELHSAVAAE